jgi:hypothetical protein
MARKTPPPRLFDVLPSGVLRQALHESLPRNTRLVWEHVGSLRVTGGLLGVLDAGSCHPRYLADESRQLDWPYPQAELAVQFAEQGRGKRSRVLAVMVAAPSGQLPGKLSGCERETAETMSIDSATAVLGDYERMHSRCRAGGPKATVLVGKGTATTKAQLAERKKAARVLEKLRLPLAVDTGYDGKSPVRFSTGLSDEQIEQARSALAAAGLSEEIWVPSAHTAMQLAEQLAANLVAWHPEGDDPFLLAFHTGYGDGSYAWDALTVDGRQCGYLCDFAPSDDEPPEEPASAAPVKVSSSAPPPGRPRFPAQLAPPLQAGTRVAVSLKRSTNCWFLGTIVDETADGYKVRMMSNEELDFPAADVVPMPDRAVFQVGDVVMAHSASGDLKPGIVRSVTSKSCQVEWHAREAPITVRIGELTFQEWLWLAVSASALSGTILPERSAADPPSPLDAAPAFGPGAAAIVRQGKKGLDICQIVSTAKGGFSVEYPSGKRETVKSQNLVPVPDRPVFRKGDAVLAVWSGAILYPGTISAISPAGYTVAWDDGSGHQIVPLGMLTFASWRDG